MEFNSFEKIKRGIINLDIQGAETISKKAIESMYYYLIENNNLLSKNINNKEVLDFFIPAIKEMYKTRPTEPMLRNGLKFFIYLLNQFYYNYKKNLNVKSLTKLISSLIEFINNYFKESDELLYEYGSKKIKNKMIVFTHCHSSAVVGILKKAKDKGIDFEVYNTETRPRFQGRITAKELSEYGIKVTHFVDSAARLALKKSDIFLFGSDAITSEGKVINKIGTEMFCEIAERFDVPRYSCTNSLKFDYESVFGFDEPIEKRNSEEIWNYENENLKIDNNAFEIVEPNLITGIFSEIGIYSSHVYCEQVLKKYPWIEKNYF